MLWVVEIVGVDKDKFPFTGVVIDELTKTMYAQDEFGYKKYGKALDPHDSEYDWMKMAEEELADLVKYLKAEQHKRDNILKHVITRIILLQQRAKSTGDRYTHNELEAIEKLLRKLIP